MPNFKIIGSLDGSGEEDLEVCFTIYERGDHVGHVTWIIYKNKRAPFNRSSTCGFGEEEEDKRTDAGA